jgi:2-C-methyl-D-erythritol 4-phosphate cytidylyltransferase
LKKYAIIVAGGTGQRMNSSIPKQFLRIQNKPILYYTLRQFKRAIPEIELILVLPKDQISTWLNLCQEFSDFEQEIPHLLTEGGESRFHSSKNGIKAITDLENCLVGIHDGVRPLVSIACIQEAYHVSLEHKNAVLSVSSKDSIRFWDSNTQSYLSINRDEVRIIQTPQVFHLFTLRKAFDQTYSELFTDDASVVEKIGETINLINGNYENIKITTPDDLLIAESLLKIEKHE